MEVRRIKQETLDALGDSFVEDVGRFVVPIFTDNWGKPVSTGTGFFLDTEFGHAFVTAAHVLDGFRDGRSFYFYATPETKRAIAGTALFSKVPLNKTRNEDLIDVVAVLLEGETDELPPFPAVGRESLSLERLEPQAFPRDRFRYAFFGFPGSKGKPNPVTREVKSKAYAYLGSSVSSEAYARLGLDEASHIVLPFNERDTYNLQAQPFEFPDPRGMSGSPLWRLELPGDGGRRAVVGVVIQRCTRESVVIATDIWFVLNILADHFQSTGRLSS